MFMSADLDDATLARAKQSYDVVVTASTWNFKELQQRKDQLPPVVNSMCACLFLFLLFAF